MIESGLPLRRRPARLPRRRRVSNGAKLAVESALIAAVCVAGAHSIPQMSGHVPKPLAALLALALFAIMWILPTRGLLLGWLLLAPLLQESAGRTHGGHILELALYTAPPLVFGLKTLVSRGRRPRREWFDYFPALFALLVLISLVASDRSALHGDAVAVFRGYYETILIGAIVYYVVAFWRARPLSGTSIMRLLLVSSAVQAAMAVVEWQTGWNLWNDTTVHQAGDFRAIATLANPALTGAFIGAGIVTALAVLCWAGPAPLRRLSKIMLVVGIIGLYATKTRGPIIATAAVGLAVLLLSSRSRLLGIGAICTVSLSLIALWPTIEASTLYRTRITQRSDVQARLVLQKVSIRLAEKRPILGWGYGSFDRLKYSVAVSSSSIPVAEALQSTSHDTYLTILVQYGLVGLGMLVLPGVVLVRRAIQRARTASPTRWLYVACVGATLVVVITGGTIDYRFFSFVPMLPWLFLALIRRQVDTDGRALPAAAVARPGA